MIHKRKIKTVSSGGNSVVLLAEKRAIQIFKYKHEYEKILEFIIDISKCDSVQINLTPQRVLKYSLFDHLSIMKNGNPHLQTIVWNRIKCLNELDTKDRTTLVTRIIEKLIWDILKIIVGLNRCGYSHGDVSLDNIGYSTDHFVLYDYNMTRKGNDMRKDLVSFARSIRFHLDQNITPRIDILLSFGFNDPLNDFIRIIQEIYDFETNDQAIDFLENLKLQSMDL